MIIPAVDQSCVKWNNDQDSKLIALVKMYKGKGWKSIAQHFPDKSSLQCLRRWEKVLNPCLNKGRWTFAEDRLLEELVQRFGLSKWSVIAKYLPGRIGSRCRDRWLNHLDPRIKKEEWTDEEDAIILHAHRILGAKWSKIANLLNGRPDNTIKNHWNTTMRRR